jgi:membrane associated rhomboid family serine protease
MNEASVGHQCPECIAEGRKTQRPVRTAFGGSSAGAHGYVTIGLIVTNVIMMILSALSSDNPARALFGGGLGGLVGGDTPLARNLGVLGEQQMQVVATGQLFFQPAGIADGQYYRLITAMFIHYGLLHIAMNMYALWILGRPLEAMLGPVRFFAVYMVCGIGGNVAVYLFAPEQLSAGASTALFGLFGVFFFVLRKLGRSASGLIPVLVINLVITFGVPGISIAGHIGGLITGAAVGYGISHAPQGRRSQIQAAVIVGAFVILGLATLWQTHQLHQLASPI